MGIGLSPPGYRTRSAHQTKAARTFHSRRRKEKKTVPELNRFRSRGCSRVGRRLGKRAAARFLLRALVNFDRAFEVGAVFDADARRGQIAIHRAILLDFNPVLRAKVA